MEFAHDDFVVGHGVAFHRHIADAGLLALDDANFDVDGIVLDSGFNGSGAEEEVSVVHIHGGDVGAAGVVAQVGFEGGFVVGVAFFDAQVFGQHVGGVDGVAGKGDVAEIELVALMDFDLYLESVLLV